MSSTGRLLDHDGGEAPGQRGVALDRAVLGQRGGADHAQLAAGEQRLEHVGGVHGALGVAGAEDRVQLVHEEDDVVGRVGRLLERCLEALLELAAVLRAGEHAGQVDGHHAGAAQGLRHVGGRDAQGQALGDGGLADAGLADQDGVVLAAAGEDLDGLLDLLRAPDHRVDAALGRVGGQVAAKAVERGGLGLGLGLGLPLAERLGGGHAARVDGARAGAEAGAEGRDALGGGGHQPLRAGLAERATGAAGAVDHLDGGGTAAAGGAEGVGGVQVAQCLDRRSQCCALRLVDCTCNCSSGPVGRRTAPRRRTSAGPGPA